MIVYWLEQVEADVSSHDDWLSTREMLQLERLSVPKRRTDWRLGRWTAKHAVATYLNMPCNLGTLVGIEIAPTASGAPEVFRGKEPAEASISITHCAGVAACAVAPSATVIGCDLELIEPRSDAFAIDYFTEGEQAMLEHLSAADRACASTLVWSAKESALKALQTGLRLDTRSVEVSFGAGVPRFTEDSFAGKVNTSSSAAPNKDGDWRSLSVLHADGQIFRGWWRCAGRIVRTIVTSPSAGVPTVLSAHPWGLG